MRLAYAFFHVSVPFWPRSVRRDHLPASEPSGLLVIIKMAVRPLNKQATTSVSPITWATPTCLPLSQSSSSAPEGAKAMSTMPAPA